MVAVRLGTVPRRPRGSGLDGGHRGDIDGLRAIAVAVVIAFHANIAWFRGGFVGVDVFFVISGFLIMGLLLRETAEHGRIDLGQFWARRARRLMPGLTVVLLATLLASIVMLSALRWRAASVDAVWSSLYVSNFSFALGTRGYFVESAAPSPFLHTWSLAVEEQFYLVWPSAMAVLVWLAGRVRRSIVSVVSWAVAAGAVVSLGLSAVLSFRSTRWAYFSLPTRWWEIGLGIATAIVTSRFRPGRGLASLLSVAGVLLLVVSMFVISPTTPYPGVAALLPTIATVALLLAGAGGTTPIGRSMASRPLQWIGRLSYSWYLWHWPAMVLASGWLRTESAWVRSAAAVVALGLAVLTERFVERPVRFHPGLVASVWKSLSVSLLSVVAVAVVGVGLYGLQQHELSDPFLAHLQQVVQERHADEATCYVDGVASDTGCDAGPLVMLVGDSHAAHWTAAMVEATSGLHLTLLVRTRGGCTSWGFSVAATGSAEPSAACVRFVSDTTAEIARRRPTAVVVANGSYAGKVLGPDGNPASPASERRVIRDAVEARIGQLVAGGSAVGVILDNPYVPFEPIECLGAERDPLQCRFRLEDGMRQVREARRLEQDAAAASDVAVFDAADGICGSSSCDTMVDGRVVYSDRTHLTREYTLSQAPALRRFVEGLALPE